MNTIINSYRDRYPYGLLIDNLLSSCDYLGLLDLLFCLNADKLKQWSTDEISVRNQKGVCLGVWSLLMAEESYLAPLGSLVFSWFLRLGDANQVYSQASSRSMSLIDQ